MGYPFSAIVGNEKAKLALLYALINPAVGGVLLTGEKGTGKSTLVRGLKELEKEKEFLEIPLHITSEHLYGHKDFEMLVQKGKTVCVPGILERAEGQLLYMDEVNLLPEEAAACIRESIGKTVIIGSMNPKEGKLAPGFLDKFGLLVYLEGEQEVKKRAEVIKRRLEYEDDPEDFCRRYEKSTNKLAEQLQQAKARLNKIEITAGAKKLAAEMVKEAECEGNRAELYLIQTARAAAAWENSKSITAVQLLEAAQYVLPHRGKRALTEKWQELFREHGREETETAEQSKDYSEKGETGGGDSFDAAGKGSKADSGGEEKLTRPTEDLRVNDWAKAGEKVRTAQTYGRHLRAENTGNWGFAARSRKEIPKTGADIAFNDTLISAALHGAAADNNSKSPILQIGMEDLHRKIRRGKTGCFVLFAVDASASMGADERMAAVKGMILSMLRNSYEKRDKIALLAFKGTDAKLILEFTNSAEVAARRLSELKTGGKTPLAEGLRCSYEILKGVMAKNRGICPVFLLVTDGRATAGEEGHPFEEALGQAERFADETIRCVVVDTEQGYVRLGLAARLAEAMNGNVISMKDVCDVRI